MTRPALPEVGLLALVPEDWSGVWQPRHQILTRLARWFTVTWLAPPLPWPEWLRRRLTDPPPPPPVGLTVVPGTEGGPAFRHPAGLERWQLVRRARRARAALARRGTRTHVVMLWRPSFAYALDTVPHDVSCYYVDDEYSFAERETPLDARERDVLERVDQVFVHSPGLLQRKGGVNPRTLMVPNGVAYTTFAAPAVEPADLAAVPRPRIGYVGRIKPQLDWAMLDALSARHPEWSFVFVGPPANRWTDVGSLFGAMRERSNVYWLGGKPVDALPAYLQHLDVSILPYRHNAYTDCIYPLKLHESLAAGVPVVGAPLRTLRDFTPVIALAEDLAGWERAVARAVTPAPDAPDRRAAGRAVARGHDWDILAHRVATALAARLGPPWTERFRAIAEPTESSGGPATR